MVKMNGEDKGRRRGQRWRTRDRRIKTDENEGEEQRLRTNEGEGLRRRVVVKNKFL